MRFSSTLETIGLVQRNGYAVRSSKTRSTGSAIAVACGPMPTEPVAARLSCFQQLCVWDRVLRSLGSDVLADADRDLRVTRLLRLRSRSVRAGFLMPLLLPVRVHEADTRMQRLQCRKLGWVRAGFRLTSLGRATA